MGMWKVAPYFSVTLLRTLVTVLFVFAMAGLVLTVVLGFEEPNDTLLLISSSLLLTAIVAVFAHLAVTKELNRSEKRIWLARLTGRKAPWALSDYLSCEDLRATAVSFLEEDR
jgi:hypothetical protein